MKKRPQSPQSKLHNVKLTDEVHAKLREHCQREGLKISLFASRIIESALEELARG